MSFEYIKFLIEEELSYYKTNQIQTIIYPSGAGGEFISIKISEHSSENYFPIRHTRSSDVNRYRIHDNSLFGILGNPSAYEQMTDFSDINQYKRFIKDKESYSFIQWYLDHLASGGKFISRAHIFVPELMCKDNTFAIYPDTEYWKNYVRKIAAIKICCDKMNLSEIKHSLWHVSDNISDSIIQKLSDMPITETEFLRVDLHLRKGMDFDYVMSITLETMLNMFLEKDSGYTTMKSIDSNLNNITVLKMSEIFESKIIEETFNISGDRFRIELSEWHDKNIQLLDKYNL